MNTKRFLLAITLALGGFASMAPTLANAAWDDHHHSHGHQVCHYDHHHHRSCHWVY